MSASTPLFKELRNRRALLYDVADSMQDAASVLMGYSRLNKLKDYRGWGGRKDEAVTATGEMYRASQGLKHLVSFPHPDEPRGLIGKVLNPRGVRRLSVPALNATALNALFFINDERTHGHGMRPEEKNYVGAVCMRVLWPLDAREVPGVSLSAGGITTQAAALSYLEILQLLYRKER